MLMETTLFCVIVTKIINSQSAVSMELVKSPERLVSLKKEIYTILVQKN